MDSQFHGKTLSRAIILVRIFLLLKHYGIIAFKRKLGWSQRPARTMVMITYPYWDKQREAEKKDPARAREIMNQPHNQGRT